MKTQTGIPRIDRIELERKSSFGPGLGMAPPGKRFCETCQGMKPKGKRKAVKGWRCDDCRERRRSDK